eukprot:jgi/Tetstr1/429494/TSEL_019400.t1
MDAPMGSLAEDAGSSLSAAPGKGQWTAAASRRRRWRRAQRNRELFLGVVDTRSKWEDMQCAVNLLLPVSDALQFIEGNTTRVSFVYLIMLHIGNDVAQWTSGALDGVLLDGQEPLSVKAFRAFHARWGATGRIQAGLYDDVHMVAYFLDPFLCRLVEELPLNAIGAFQKIFGKFCDDVELAQCVNEFMKFHNGDGGYGMMKDFAEQTHQREFARLKEKYLRDHNLGKLPHCVSEAIMYCQAAMSNALELSLFRYEERLGKQRDYDLKSKLREEPVRSAKTASHVETIEALKALAINRDFPTDMRSLSHRLLDTPVYAV